MAKNVKEVISQSQHAAKKESKVKNFLYRTILKNNIYQEKLKYI